MKGFILIRCPQRSAKRAGEQARASQAWSTAPVSGLDDSILRASKSRYIEELPM